MSPLVVHHSASSRSPPPTSPPPATVAPTLPQAARSLNNIEEGYYISPAFLDKLSIHIAKNFLDLPKIKVPLILGIWGGKGQGKTFQCNLAYKKLGISPIVMSAGELESGNAGEPAKLIRQRYREASDVIKKGEWTGCVCAGGGVGAVRKACPGGRAGPPLTPAHTSRHRPIPPHPLTPHPIPRPHVVPVHQ